MATDFLGNELSVGDDVVFVNYKGTSADLERGTITKIFPHQADIGIKRRAEYKIVKLPTVKHGFWDGQIDKTHFCNCCGFDAPYDYEGVEMLTDYCPNCGAKMTDGDK